MARAHLAPYTDMKESKDMDYLERCDRAAEDQGVSQLVSAINAAGISATVIQSGGFTMVAYVELSDDKYIYANPYGASIYNYDDDDYIADIVQFNDQQDPAVIAAAISDYLKNKGE